MKECRSRKKREAWERSNNVGLTFELEMKSNLFALIVREVFSAILTNEEYQNEFEEKGNVNMTEFS